MEFERSARSSEGGPSSLKHLKSLCESFSLFVQTIVVEAHQHVADATLAFSDNPQLEASVKRKKEDCAAVQETCKKKDSVYEK